MTNSNSISILVLQPKEPEAPDPNVNRAEQESAVVKHELVALRALLEKKQTG